MNETETRAEFIDPALKAAGWGVVDGSRAHFGDRDHVDRYIVIGPIGDHDRSGATLGGG